MTVSADDEARIVARERLRILAIGHYVYGGIGLVSLCFMGAWFLFVFGMIVSVPQSEWNKNSASPSPPASHYSTPTASPTPDSNATAGPPPKAVFLLFGGIFAMIVIGIGAVSALTVYAGRCIQKRKHRILIYVVSGINCIFIPYGTFLGVFTILAMGSPAAMEEFRGSSV